MAYTIDDRAAALAALQSNGNNVRRTARDIGIGDATLRRWVAETDARKNAALEARLPAAKASLADRLREFVDAALTVAPGKLSEANLRDVMTSVGISIDKLQLLEGKPTSIGEVRDGLSDEERASRVEALLERARERRTGRATN